MNGPLLILADCYLDAWNYVHDRALGQQPTAWRYVSSLSDVLGYQSPAYVNICRGSVRGLALWDRIEAAAHLRIVGVRWD